MQVNIKDFGAIGDGASDDSAAIQAAINVAGVTKIVVPSGNYNVSTTIRLKSNLIIQGEGQTSIIERRQDIVLFDGNGVSSTVQSHQNLKNVRFRDLKLNGNGFGSNSPAIDMDATYEWKIQDVEFNGFFGSAIQTREFWDSQINGCQFNFCGNRNQGTPVIDFQSSQSGFELVRDIKFSKNRFESCYGVGIKITGANGVAISLDDNKMEFTKGQLESMVVLEGCSLIKGSGVQWFYGDPVLYEGYLWTAISSGSNLGETSFTIDTGINYNENQGAISKTIYDGMPLVIWDNNDARNYQIVRISSYDVVTGDLVVSVISQHGNSSVDILAWKASPIHLPLIDINNCSMVELDLDGGFNNNGLVPTVSFINVNNSYDINLGVNIVSGYNRLPAYTFQALSSSSALTIGLGQQSLIVDIGRDIDVGDVIGISGSNRNNTTNNHWNNMSGDVISYDSATGDLVANITTINGSGALSDWIVNTEQPNLVNVVNSSNVNVKVKGNKYGKPAGL